MYKVSGINILRAKVSGRVVRATPAMRAYLFKLNQAQPAILRMPQAFFATKNDKDASQNDETVVVKKAERTKR